jgi:FlaA1/EpsC-like NDP-sugar epimerase
MLNLDGLNLVNQRVLLVGYGVIGKQILTRLLDIKAEVVGIVDDINKSDLIDSSYRIENLALAIRELKPTIILVTASLFRSAKLNQITVDASNASLPVYLVPERAEFFLSDTKEMNFRTPTLEDLFARNSLVIDFEETSKKIKGKRVLVTGAGGSIGSRIALHAFNLGAIKVGLLDRDDCLLHDVAVEITGNMHDSRTPLFVVDIQFPESVNKVFSDFRPEIVVHAAALKHVTTLEAYPQNALSVNVLGTLNVLKASEKFEVNEFINISTDKAASTENVLGVSKYITERMTAAVDVNKAKSVRFGNVLGSRASVMNTFKIQARHHSKLTVRGEETTRFFMTNNEAASLSLSTLTSSETSGTFVFNMGKPVRILDLAQEIAKSELEETQIFIEDLHSGEVIHEKLFRDEEVPKPTSVDQVFCVEPPKIDLSKVQEVLSNPEDIYNLTDKQARVILNNLLVDE